MKRRSQGYPAKERGSFTRSGFQVSYTKIKPPAAGGRAADESSQAECRTGSLEGQVGVVF